MFRLVITKYFLSYYNIFNILFMLFIGLFIYKFNGYYKKRNIISYNMLQNLFIIFIIYYVLIYLMGLVFGYLSNPYSMNIILILKNLFILIIFILIREWYRYIVIRQVSKNNYIPFIIVTLLLSLFDIIMEISGYNLTYSGGIFEFIESSVIPNISLNLILSYFAYNYNYKIAVIYALLIKTPVYFMPLYPDLGKYFGTIINLVFMFYSYFKSSLIIENYERKTNKRINKKSNVKLYLMIIPLIVFISLISGLFKYHLFAIGSNSMVPYFSKGDTVLIEKLNIKEQENLKVGDVLAFYNGKIIIVHRITEIKEINDKKIYITKGDNNPNVDNILITSDNIYGKVILTIKYLGIPSIELRELFDK